MSYKNTSKFAFNAENLLGTHIGQKDSRMHEQACLSPEFREMLGDIDALNDTMNFLEGKISREEWLKRVIIDWGTAAWPRDIVTDLSLKYGDKTQIEKALKKWPRRNRALQET